MNRKMKQKFSHDYTQGIFITIFRELIVNKKHVNKTDRNIHLFGKMCIR